MMGVIAFASPVLINGLIQVLNLFFKVINVRVKQIIAQLVMMEQQKDIYNHMIAYVLMNILMMGVIAFANRVIFLGKFFTFSLLTKVIHAQVLRLSAQAVMIQQQIES